MSDVNEKYSKEFLIENICKFNLTPEQKDICYSEDENIIVNGVPGSAKTTTLVLRLVKKLKSNKKYNIILLTKVSNVTEELVNRILEYLPEIKILEDNWEMILEEYKNVKLTSIKGDLFFGSDIIKTDKWKKFYIKWYGDIPDKTRKQIRL